MAPVRQWASGRSAVHATAVSRGCCSRCLINYVAAFLQACTAAKVLDACFDTLTLSAAPASQQEAVGSSLWRSCAVPALASARAEVQLI